MGSSGKEDLQKYTNPSDLHESINPTPQVKILTALKFQNVMFLNLRPAR